MSGHSPLVTRPGAVAVMPPALLPPASYYATLARYPEVAFDTAMRYDKRRKEVHRFAIADKCGEVKLTVPVSRPEGAFAQGNLTWDRVVVSAHGRWWETIPATLATAYGRTPFFDYYIDRLMPLFAPRPLAEPEPITDLCLQAHDIVSGILGLTTRVVGLDSAMASGKAERPQTIVCRRPYWQVRQDKLGFIGGLSILDLIFNLGPDAPFYLLDEAASADLAIEI